jgi:regulator of sigma E protease
MVFFVVLSILIIVHELGHFLVAKRNGILVEEFGFGLPPRIWGKKIGETLWSINLLPFGGFVKLHGELGEDGITNKNRAFLYKSKRTKIAVIIAGVIMNFLLGIVAFAIVYSFSGIPRETGEVKILDISSSSPAQEAKLIVGDIIKKVDKEDVKNVSEFVLLVENKKGKKVTLELQDRKVTITPRSNPPEGEGPLGVTISSSEIYFPPVWQRPFYGIYYGFKEAVFWGKNVIVGFSNIFIDLFKGQTPKDISGPVGVFAITTQAAKLGLLSLINLLGIISVNLAILNILPFPALDGGRLLFIFIEKLIGKKIIPKVEAIIHSIGMIILLLLILAITINDIKGLIRAGSISGFLDNMTK